MRDSHHIAKTINNHEFSSHGTAEELWEIHDVFVSFAATAAVTAARRRSAGPIPMTGAHPALAPSSNRAAPTKPILSWPQDPKDTTAGQPRANGAASGGGNRPGDGH